MRKLLITALITLTLLAPVNAEAGVRSALKKTGSHIVHVLDNAVYASVITATIIVMCKVGACG